MKLTCIRLPGLAHVALPTEQVEHLESFFEGQGLDPPKQKDLTEVYTKSRGFRVWGLGAPGGLQPSCVHKVCHDRAPDGPNQHLAGTSGKDSELL